MPGMTGLELAQEIRRSHADLPVVLTSGYSHLLSEQGSHGFELLQKPYSVEQLSRVLHRGGQRKFKQAPTPASS
jgi:two-component system, NtrC family, sensor kinase